MAHPSKRKGDRCEREIVELHRAAGIPAHRVPLSGSVGGVYGGDLRIAGSLRAEVKARACGSGFATLERWLAGSDLLFLRRDRSSPLVVLPWDTYLHLALRGPTPTPPAGDAVEGNGKRCKALGGTICQRPGCTQAIPTGRARGSPRRFCSGRCRWAAWKARQRS